MTCEEAQKLTTLHCTELEQEHWGALQAHLAACPACESMAHDFAAVDAWVLAAAGDIPDTTETVRRFRKQTASRSWMWAKASAFVAAAAAIVLLVVIPPAKMYGDAAEDHRDEVIKLQPRRWRISTNEMDALGVQMGLAPGQAAALAVPGYRLQRAKICRIHGQRMLHLVFGDANRAYSLFVRAHTGPADGVHVVEKEDEAVASLATNRLIALLVTETKAKDCEDLAKSTVLKL